MSLHRNSRKLAITSLPSNDESRFVESDWPAEVLQVRARRLEVAEGRFARGEVQGHQPTDTVIPIRQQRTGRRPALKPAMVAAVDVHRLAQAGPSCTRLIDLRRSQFARHLPTQVV